jgi:hypothetical protein
MTNRAGGGRPWAALCIVLSAIPVIWGCTKRVPVQAPDSGRIKARAVFVTTTDGTEYRFRWAEVQDTTLVGHYRIEEEVSRDGFVEIVEADRSLLLPASQVRSIEVKRFDLERTLFLAGGTAVVGYFFQTLLPEDAPAPKDDGTIKDPPRKQ